MHVLITGADSPLARALAEALQGEHRVRLTGLSPLAPAGSENLEYVPADLREPSEAAAAVGGVDAIAHLAVFPAFPTPTPVEEALCLDQAARGTYVLLTEALRAGVGRVALASRLDLVAAYPDDYLVDETWKPLPVAAADALAPYLAELSLREIARAEERLHGVALRFGPLGSAPDGTTVDDAVRALTSALTMDLTGEKYRWRLYHIGSTDRWPLGGAAHRPLAFVRA